MSAEVGKQHCPVTQTTVTWLYHVEMVRKISPNEMVTLSHTNSPLAEDMVRMVDWTVYKRQ